jgi:hypothetical protein
VVNRQPNTGLVADMGVEGVQKELKIISTRASAPRIVDVEFNDVGFVYSHDAHHPMAWGLAPVQGKTSVVYDNLARLDLYENNRVFIIGPNNRELAAITFGNPSDAEGWCDLVLSLKASYLESR